MKEEDYISNLLDRDFEAYEMQTILRRYKTKSAKEKRDKGELQKIRNRAAALVENMKRAEISHTSLARKIDFDRGYVYTIFEKPLLFEKYEGIIRNALTELAKEKIATLNELLGQIEGVNDD